MRTAHTLGLALLLAAASTSSALAGKYFGKPFPNFKATDAITGEPVSLEDLRGQVVLIKFWATW